MSDQEFKGLNPKSKEGESIFFYSMDYWIGLCECIRMVYDESFPPYVSMDEENAGYLAEAFQRRLDYGLFKTYFEHSASKMFDDEREAADYVETMLGYTVQFIEFLMNCGGSKPV
jgi:hypothetical protein